MAFEPCKNCGTLITCGCQYQLASDGTHCCDDCIQAYELTLYPVNNIVEKVEEQKNIEQNEQSFNELPDGIDDEANDE